jgi:hypothetical protein
MGSREATRAALLREATENCGDRVVHRSYGSPSSHFSYPHRDLDTFGNREAFGVASLRGAIEDCRYRVSERRAVTERNDYAGEEKANGHIARAIHRTEDHAATAQDAGNSKRVAQNYTQGDSNAKDAIIKSLSTTLLYSRIIGMAATCALSCAAIGAPIQFMNAGGQLVNGTVVDTGSGYTLLSDANNNGFVDTMQDCDATGNGLGVAESMSNAYALITASTALLALAPTVACITM